VTSTATVGASIWGVISDIFSRARERKIQKKITGMKVSAHILDQWTRRRPGRML
jgi:hypothetical protein